MFLIEGGGRKLSRMVRLPLMGTLEASTEAAIDAALKHAGVVNLADDRRPAETPAYFVLGAKVRSMRI
jgi:hypothetical protein